MPSFDISSNLDWQELDNAINQATKEVSQRFDFKGIKCEIKMDQKLKTVTFWCSEEGKLEALVDVFQNKAVKRGISLLAFEYKEVEPAFGASVRRVASVQSGISKEKGKEIIAALKDSKLKVQGQIQDEQVRVNGKNRDDLQAAIANLREKQSDLKISMSFGNFRD